MRAPFAFQKLADNAPSCIEFAHYGYIHPTFDDYYRNGLTIVECLKNSRATFAGFHGYPRVFLKSDKWLAEYCANRLGYWYFIDSALIPDLTASAHNHIKLRFTNKGWAKAYYRHSISLMLRGDNGETRLIDTDARVDGIDSERSRTFDLNLDLRGLPGGSYEILAGVFEGKRPIKLALKAELEENGFYRIARRNVKAL